MTLHFEPTSDVRVTCDAHVLRVTIDRPEKRNPLSLGILEEIRHIFTRYSKDDSVALAIISASGNKAFASGGDLRELASFRSEQDGIALSRHGKAALDSIRSFPVPVVARINGVALGGGAELALACDIRIATASAKLGFIHSRLKIVPSWGGGVDLVRLVGSSRAIRMMAEAKILDVHQARDWGLIDQNSVDDESFNTFFENYIDGIRDQPPHVMRAIKSLIIANRAVGRIEADRSETEHFAKAWAHEDHWNAVNILERQKT